MSLVSLKDSYDNRSINQDILSLTESLENAELSYMDTMILSVYEESLILNEDATDPDPADNSNNNTNNSSNNSASSAVAVEKIKEFYQKIAKITSDFIANLKKAILNAAKTISNRGERLNAYISKHATEINKNNSLTSEFEVKDGNGELQQQKITVQLAKSIAQEYQSNLNKVKALFNKATSSSQIANEAATQAANLQDITKLNGAKEDVLAKRSQAKADHLLATVSLSNLNKQISAASSLLSQAAHPQDSNNQ